MRAGPRADKPLAVFVGCSCGAPAKSVTGGWPKRLAGGSGGKPTGEPLRGSELDEILRSSMSQLIIPHVCTVYFL